MTRIELKTDPITQQAADFKALVGGSKSVLVTTHAAPDGDAIASLLAATEIVRGLYSRPVCALDGLVPGRFRFFPGANGILIPQQLSAHLAKTQLDAAVVLDCGSLSRIGKIAEEIPAGTPLASIDHHPDNTRFAELNIIDPAASSTTEILGALHAELDLPLSPALALLLYTGLMTDTGGFRFSNTSEKTFALAARLVHAGIDPAQIARNVYCTNSASSIRMLGGALGSLELNADGRIATMTALDWDSGEEFEDAVDFALTVKGVQAAAFFRISNGSCRVSLRAGGEYDVAHIARQFGGGGHQKSAGFTYHGSLEEIRPQVIEALSEEIGDFSVPIADPS